MASYYYLMAQLPYLWLERTPPLTEDDFLTEAQKWLNAADYRLLQQIELDTIDLMTFSDRFLIQYQEFEKKIRSEVYRYRQARVRGKQYKLVRWLEPLVKQGNPLQQEQGLLRLRWEFIDNIALQYHFSFSAVSIYYLKLKLTHRFSLFDRKQGRQNFIKISDFYLEQKQKITKYNN